MMEEVFDDILERFIETGLRIEEKHNIPFHFKEAMERLSKCQSRQEIEQLYHQRLKSGSFGIEIEVSEIEENDASDLGNIKLQLLNAAISTHRKKLDALPRIGSKTQGARTPA